MLKKTSTQLKVLLASASCASAGGTIPTYRVEKAEIFFNKHDKELQNNCYTYYSFKDMLSSPVAYPALSCNLCASRRRKRLSAGSDKFLCYLLILQDSTGQITESIKIDLLKHNGMTIALLLHRVLHHI